VSGRRPDRRAAWLAGAAAVMPVAVASFPLMPAEAVAPKRFAPPDSTMVLTRTLRRSLPGGEEVLTRRSYEIRFVPDGGGYRIDGRLVGVEVDAPTNLQALAMLEKRRSDADMFPMRLDAQGMLVPQVTPPPQAEEVRQAALSVGREIDAHSFEPFDLSQAKAFAATFEKRSVRTAWPEDLFHPSPGLREEIRTVPLPNGARGTVRVTINASAHGGTGLLGSFVRRVTTDLEGDSRVTEETWTLTAKG
jgi:hypothetical protein